VVCRAQVLDLNERVVVAFDLERRRLASTSTSAGARLHPTVAVSVPAYRRIDEDQVRGHRCDCCLGQFREETPQGPRGIGWRRALDVTFVDGGTTESDGRERERTTDRQLMSADELRVVLRAHRYCSRSCSRCPLQVARRVTTSIGSRWFAGLMSTIAGTVVLWQRPVITGSAGLEARKT